MDMNICVMFFFAIQRELSGTLMFFVASCRQKRHNAKKRESSGQLAGCGLVERVVL